MSAFIDYLLLVMLLSSVLTAWIWTGWFRCTSKMFDQRESTKSSDNHPAEDDTDAL